MWWQNENTQHWIRRIKSFIYISVILVFFLIFILELKHAYNINIFPGVNGPLDDIYFKLKDSL
ncbi:MAG: hypothetical protein CFE21_15215 [Bacteroidetes bacterium B1(2017)]|nr:MAG: hypothetical protein CFE21_15215 [Bacteroidetes bacterium B1(2017)]